MYSCNVHAEFDTNKNNRDFVRDKDFFVFTFNFARKKSTARLSQLSIIDHYRFYFSARNISKTHHHIKLKTELKQLHHAENNER